MGFTNAEGSYSYSLARDFENIMSFHWSWTIIDAYEKQIQPIRKAVCDVLGIDYVSPEQKVAGSNPVTSTT